MKKSKEIIGSPIISIQEGIQIGVTKGLVINPQQKNIEFLLLDEPGEGEKLRGLSYRSAQGVGEFAVTVEDSSIIVDLMKVGILRELVQKEIHLLGTKVVTRKGRLLGEVTEYAINTETGELAEVFFSAKGETEQSLPASSIITIGKEVLIVENGETDKVAADDNLPPIVEGKENFERGNDGSTLKGEIPAVEKSRIDHDFAALSSAAERDLLRSEPQGDSDPTEIFMQRQRQYLIGKTLFKDFKTVDGEVIAWENQIITEELLDRVYQLGTQKLMELAMSVRD
ncbi:MAG TPA: hypothetical protein GXZ24_05935 [Firmicutes bacterium]|nr:hypothetical protein [Bacillota bacterium]